MGSELSGFLVDGRLPCQGAYRVKESWKKSMGDVGDAATQAQVKISLCQLGLFGYEEFGDKQMMSWQGNVPERIRRALASEGDEISCARAWALASELAISRLLLGNVLEVLGICVVECQLRCF